MQNEAISDKIQAVYEAFEAVPRPGTIDGCPCCADTKEIGILVSKPRSELSSEELSSFAFSATRTVGEGHDLQYLLPRIFDLVLTDPDWWVDVEVIFGNLGNSRWQSWPAEQQKAIQDLAYTALDEFAQQGEAGMDEFDSWVCGMARAGVSPLPYLKSLLEDDRVDHLMQFHLANANSLMKGKLTNAFWEKEHSAPIVEWLESPAVKAKLEKAYTAKYVGDGSA